VQLRDVQCFIPIAKPQTWLNYVIWVRKHS
jgi:hypothetical protein